MIVRIPLIGLVKLWYIGAVLLGINLVYFAVENMGGNVAHLAGVLFRIYKCAIFEKRY